MSLLNLAKMHKLEAFASSLYCLYALHEVVQVLSELVHLESEPDHFLHIIILLLSLLEQIFVESSSRNE